MFIYFKSLLEKVFRNMHDFKFLDICYIFFRTDAWLPKGIAAYLAHIFVKKSFGNNEYRHTIAQVSIEVTVNDVHCDYNKYMSH